MMEKNYSV